MLGLLTSTVCGLYHLSMRGWLSGLAVCMHRQRRSWLGPSRIASSGPRSPALPARLPLSLSLSLSSAPCIALAIDSTTSSSQVIP